MKLVINALLALVFVLSLIWVVTLGLKKYGPEKIAFAFSGMKKLRSNRRLQIVEMMPLDARRRLVLCKRDNQEHLILLGLNGETVVEKNIGKSEHRWQRKSQNS